MVLEQLGYPRIDQTRPATKGYVCCCLTVCMQQYNRSLALETGTRTTPREQRRVIAGKEELTELPKRR